MKKALTLLIFISFVVSPALAGLDFVRSNGISLTGADGIRFIGPSGISLTGADGFLPYRSNGISLTGADGINPVGSNGISLTGADGSTYTGPNGITLTGADGISLTGADGITLTGADGITLTGADGVSRVAQTLIFQRPDGITLTGADGITLTGADGISLTGADGLPVITPSGITLTGADGITLTGADGITLTGADGITLTGADSVLGLDPTGVLFDIAEPAGITLTGADGITLTGADGITLTGADGIVIKNIFGLLPGVPEDGNGLLGLDAELAVLLNTLTDDSNVNAVVVFHNQVTEANLNQLRQIGILGGTRFRVLPMVYVTGTKAQITAISHLPAVRSIYGNRTFSFNSDPYFKSTGVTRVSSDSDLSIENSGLAVTGKNVTVAVLDTGINAFHPDLAGKVVQNVRLLDTQSLPLGFMYPLPLQNLPTTDLLAGHGTFVSGEIAGSGALSGGKYNGVAPGSRLLGLSAGDLNLTNLLSGFDYLLDKGPQYNVRVVNCSFSANTVFDYDDPVNVATKMLTDRGVSVVFSAGNTGPGNGTLNPYAMPPWVIGVGATDQNGSLAAFSGRGTFGNAISHPTLVAPGVNIASVRSLISTTSVGGLGGADFQRLSLMELPFYTTSSGTSFSAPQVTGAIALMLEANPQLTPAEIKDILPRTATPMPKYYVHEVGAGMLNTYGAVLEAAFPARHMGTFRATLSRNRVRFTTATTQTFAETVYPGMVKSINVGIPANTIQASVGIAWSSSINDFGLKLFNSGNTMVGESNYLNLPGLTGRFEEVVLKKPGAQVLRSAIQHTAGVGLAQTVHGAVDITRVEYPALLDLGSLSTENRAEAEKSLLSNIVLPEGRMFRPNSAVSRSGLASVLIRAGLTSQYLAGNPMFSDVSDLETRNAVESVQSNLSGKLIFDASSGGRFYPYAPASKLVTAVALVKAANLENLTNTTFLPLLMPDTASIPAAWRGYVAVALQKGFLTMDGNKFNPNRAVTRIELARAVNAILK